jgi:hypothetical protein
MPPRSPRAAGGPSPGRTRRLTPEAVKGWASSLTLHGALLLVMALSYFAPRPTAVRVLDTRLLGSDLGVEEGLTATGGLNTPLDTAPTPEPPPDPALSGLAPLEITPPEPSVTLRVNADRPAAGGGVDNPNPGAGAGDGFGLARFGEGGESIRGVQVKVGDPQFTLLWDTPVDLDLHVIEPGGKEIYWEEPRGNRGGELDVDNTRGFGPENVYWLGPEDADGRRRKGQGPPGEYRWFVVYWGGFGGIPKPTRWKVRIKHAGKVSVVTGRFRALNERSRVYTLKVSPPEGDSPP